MRYSFRENSAQEGPGATSSQEPGTTNQPGSHLHMQIKFKSKSKSESLSETSFGCSHTPKIPLQRVRRHIYPWVFNHYSNYDGLIWTLSETAVISHKRGSLLPPLPCPCHVPCPVCTGGHQCIMRNAMRRECLFS